jgi:3-oxoacyl-[acyl-carrier protein] reductase
LTAAGSTLRCTSNSSTSIEASDATEERGMGRLAGKVAVVTGASKGIGAGIARALAAEGARVVVNYATGRADAERVVADIVAREGRAIAVPGDVSKAEDVARLFAETRRAFGRVDVLVNNAGIYRFAPLEEVTEAEFQRQFGVNVLGTLLVAREAVRHLPPEGGSIINVSSVASEAAPPGTVVYSATKGAVDTITRVLAKELAPRKIRVNTLAPGGVDTEGARSAGLAGSDFERRVVAATPLGRFGRPEDIAGVAVFLASDEAAWITGERIAAAGGFR